MKTFIGQSMAGKNMLDTPEINEIEAAPDTSKQAPLEFDPEGESSLIPGSLKLPKDKDVHLVSAIYPNKLEAEVIRQRLVDKGILPRQIDILENLALAEKTANDSDEVLKHVVIDGGIGTVVGAGVGAIGTIAMIASNITFFVASPFLAPLAMLGWFAGIGGVVGAAVGVTQKREKFSELVTDSIKSGNVVLITQTKNETEREVANSVIRDSLEARNIVPAEFSSAG